MNSEIKLTDSKQIAYLSMKGVKFKKFIRDGNKKVFIYDNSDQVDLYLAEFYNSEVSDFIGHYEQIKTLIFRS